MFLQNEMVSVTSFILDTQLFQFDLDMMANNGFLCNFSHNNICLETNLRNFKDFHNLTKRSVAWKKKTSNIRRGFTCLFAQFQILYSCFSDSLIHVFVDNVPSCSRQNLETMHCRSLVDKVRPSIVRSLKLSNCEPGQYQDG